MRRPKKTEHIIFSDEVAVVNEKGRRLDQVILGITDPTVEVKHLNDCRDGNLLCVVSAQQCVAFVQSVQCRSLQSGSTKSETASTRTDPYFIIEEGLFRYTHAAQSKCEAEAGDMALLEFLARLGDRKIGIWSRRKGPTTCDVQYPIIIGPVEKFDRALLGIIDPLMNSSACERGDQHLVNLQREEQCRDKTAKQFRH
jgi:hypothetical protein